MRFRRTSRNKYGNTKIRCNGEVYDSKKEYQRACELSLLERAGRIADLRRQVKFLLIPTQREPDEIGPRGGGKKGKVIEHEVSYLADFVYTDLETGGTVVEDTKGMRTKDYIIKRKLMLYIHNIKIREV